MNNEQQPLVLIDKTELFNEQEYKIYCAARKLADLVFVAAIKLNENPEFPRILNYFDDRRKETPGCYVNRPQQGLILEFYYGNPSRIHTPWGRWHFNGSTSSHPKYKDENHPAWNGFKIPEDVHKFHEKALEQLGVELTLHVPGEQTKLGYFGPYYKVKQVEKSHVPNAVNDESPLNYEIVRNKWKAMTERYDLEQDISSID